jgi:CMP-N,N'-diacetyllegionaminic acid synthase
MKKKSIWSIVAARSGSKGLPGKNIRSLAGKPLIAHAINFSVKSGVFEKVLLSTESSDYAKIGEEYGAWVPFLRGTNAAQDDSMEEDVLADLEIKLKEHAIPPPEIIVWLRPTFPFRSIEDLKLGLSELDESTDSVRLVTEGEPRLYEIQENCLIPRFEDGGRSMIRRQEFPATYKVFHTDIFWYKNIKKGRQFLGEKIKPVCIHKLCSMDVDSVEDFELIEAIISSNSRLVKKYSN